MKQFRKTSNTRRMRAARQIILSSPLPLIGLCGQPAQAADVPVAPPPGTARQAAAVPSQTNGGEVIVITATRRRENIQTVPLAVTAISGADLRRQGITDTPGLVAAVPGLTYAKSGTSTPIYSLRGVGFNTRNLSATSPVGIYVNESSYAYPFMGGGPIFDLARVEVIKGPQGTLFGRNTTGGLIDFITVRPGSTPEARVEAGYGNYDSFEGELELNVPLSKSLGLRIAARDEERGRGWQQSVSRPGDRLGKKSLQGARASLDWHSTDGISSELTVNYWRNNSDTEAVQPVFLRADQPAFLPPDIGAAILTHPRATDADWDPPSPGKPDFKARDNFIGISERITVPLGPHDTLISLSGFNRLKRDDFNDMDGTPYEFNAYHSVGKITSLSQEVRVSGDRNRLKYTLGAYYAHDDLRDSEVGYVNDATTILALRYLASLIPQTIYSPEEIATGFRNFFDRSHQKNQTMSVFGNVQYKLTDRLEWDGGLRYGRDRLSYAGCSYDYHGNTAPIWNTAIAFLTGATDFVGPNECLTYKPGYAERNSPLFRSELKQNNLSFRTSLNYQMQQLLLYASIARGFKNGAYPLIPANLDTQLTPARQEQLTAYEIGAKASVLKGGDLKLRADAFYYDYRDKQTYGAIPDPVFITLNRIINIPKSRVYGVEGDANWHMGSGFSVDLAGTLLSSKVLKYEGFDLLGQPEDFAGKQLTFTPKVQLSASVAWDRPITSKLGIGITALWSYRSHSWGDLENSAPYRLKASDPLNVELALHRLDEKWRVALWAENLLNQYYWTYTGYERETVYRVPAMPRTFGARVSYSLW